MAAAVVDHMVTADLWGRQTHGLSVRYAASLQRAADGIGRQAPEVVDDRGSTLVLDDHDGFGTGAGAFAADLLVERAREHGLASVALRNTGHTGMLGYFADRGAQSGVVTMAFTHCRPMVTPPGGSKALFGSNPVAFAFPAQPDPVLIDLSTAAVTFGEILVLARQGGRLPEGVAFDAAGEPTTDPESVRGGAVRPWGGHRGGALAAAIQLMAGVMTGAQVFPPGGAGYGLLLIGIAKGRFADDDGYDRAVAEFVAGYEAAPALPGEEVRVPGRRRYENARQAQGRLEISAELTELLRLSEA